MGRSFRLEGESPQLETWKSIEFSVATKAIRFWASRSAVQVHTPSSIGASFAVPFRGRMADPERSPDGTRHRQLSGN